MKKIIILLISFSSFVAYSQIEDFTKEKSRNNSFGLEYRFESFTDANIGLVYRRYFESKYNFKGSFNIGGYSNLNEPWNNGRLLIHRTNDSLTPIIGVSRSDAISRSFQRLEFGIERELTFWKLKFIAGIDGFIGHRVDFRYNSVSEMELVEIEQNGNIYEEYQIVSRDSTQWDNSLNRLDLQRNYLTIGANFNLGLKVNISDKFFATTFLGYRMQQNVLFRERIDYESEIYKEHIPGEKGGSFNFGNWFYSLGLNYRF